MKSTVIAYGIPAEKLGKLRFACVRCKLRLREVLEGEDALPVAQILIGPGPVDVGPAQAEGELVVLCGLVGAQLDAFCAAVKPSFPTLLKAVLTPTNADWTCSRLFSELSAERDALSRGETLHRPDRN